MAAVVWTGLDALSEALRTLPEHLAGEAQGIVQTAATDALSEMAAAYPHRSGNLARGLKKTETALGRYGVGYRVTNTAPHAWWYEHGTQARHTRKGVSRGAMWGGPTPPGHVVIPVAIRQRRTMYTRLKAMLEREGLGVTGDAP